MATFFWVNNGGDWSDTSHWSTSSGGVGGAGFPGSVYGVDTAILDAHSFSIPGQRISFGVSGDATPVHIDTLDFSAVTNNPHIDLGSFGGDFLYNPSINIYNSLVCGPATLTLWSSQALTMFAKVAVDSTLTVKTNGLVLPGIVLWNNTGATGNGWGNCNFSFLDNVTFDDSSGGLTFETAVGHYASTATITMLLNGHNLTLPTLAISTTGSTLNFDASTITVTTLLAISSGVIVSSNGTTWVTTGATITAAKGALLTSPSSWNFTSGPVTLNDITIKGSTNTNSNGTIVIHDPGIPGDGGGNPGWTFKYLYHNSTPSRIVSTAHYGTPAHPVTPTRFP